ncbi:acyl carrier protein [Streptomyces sp. cg2]|uniref:acyl carrier protein n=1 Tax=Streptomyces sp. cg2 TaxID=3238799 RepID=UPI0034E28488
MQNISQQIVDVLVKKFEVDEGITATTKFTDLELDSLIMLELSVVLERTYGVRIPEDELLDAGNVAGVASLIESTVKV